MSIRANSSQSQQHAPAPPQLPLTTSTELLLTQHVHTLTRLLISQLRDLNLISHAIKPRKSLFYTRYEWKRVFSQLVSREEVRVWRGELLLENWLRDLEGGKILQTNPPDPSSPSTTNPPHHADSADSHNSSPQSDELLQQALSSFKQLSNTPTHQQNDHQIFTQIIKLIHHILSAESQMVESIYILLRFICLLREQYLEQLRDILQHVQRIKLRKDDERDVYKCVYSYTREDQGSDNDVLLPLREELKNDFVEPLSNLMMDSKATLVKMLDAVRRRMQEAYRKKLLQYEQQDASIITRMDRANEDERDHAPSHSQLNNNDTIELEFTDELLRSKNAASLLKMSHPEWNSDHQHSASNHSRTSSMDTREIGENPSLYLDETHSEELHHESSKMHSNTAQKNATEVQAWIDRQLFWKEKKDQLREQRQKEIEEHASYMDQYLQQVSAQREEYKKRKQQGNKEALAQWEAAITVQCAFRRYHSLSLKSKKLHAISLLQRVFRFYAAKRTLEKLKDEDRSNRNVSAQEKLWRRRQQLYYATEVPDSQLIYCHIMLRREMQEIEGQLRDSLVEYEKQWDRFVRKTQKEMMRRPLRPEWTEQAHPTDPGKKMYMNIITGTTQQTHPNLSNMKKYLSTEQKRHQEALSQQQESLSAYRDQLVQQEVSHRNQFMKVYEEALREVSDINFG